jgi:bacterioferritin
MQGDQRVLEYLNNALRHELTAVNQYWLHYRILDNWGFKDLAKTWRKESIEEMEHADLLVARILFLEGHPNMHPSDELRIGQDLKQILDYDLAAEVAARALYIEAARHCESANDRVSKNLFEKLTQDEEGHIDFLETQLELIRQIGVELYAQKHMGGLEE